MHRETGSAEALGPLLGPQISTLSSGTGPALCLGQDLCFHVSKQI